MDSFALTVPISNAGMGFFATPELAIAVSEAGGLGAVGTGRGAVAATVKDYVTRARAGTRRPFVVNYLLATEPATLPLALDAGTPIIQFAWGLPTREMTTLVRRAGAKMGVQVSSRVRARQALDLGADYLICQGTEALATSKHSWASMKHCQPWSKKPKRCLSSRLVEFPRAHTFVRRSWLARRAFSSARDSERRGKLKDTTRGRRRWFKPKWKTAC